MPKTSPSSFIVMAQQFCGIKVAIKMCAFLVGFSQDVYSVSGFFLQSAVVSIRLYGKPYYREMLHPAVGLNN